MNKPFIFIFALVIAPMFAWAQVEITNNRTVITPVRTDIRPAGAGNFTFDLQYNFPSLGNDPMQGDILDPRTGLKFRYFATDALAIRLSTNFQSRTSSTNPESNVVREDFTGYVDVKPGIEYHFKKTDRLSAYVGGQLVFANATSETMETRTDAFDNGVRTRTSTTTDGAGFVAFGAGLVLGADYYISNSFFMGIETSLVALGLGEKDVVTESVDVDTRDNPTTEVRVTTTTERGTSGYFGFMPTAALRLGFVF